MTARPANRRERRAHAKALTRADVDIERVIPAPPPPAWDHWWHPHERTWYRHDERLLRYAQLLRAVDAGLPDGCEIDDCTAIDTQIRHQLAALEP